MKKAHVHFFIFQGAVFFLISSLFVVCTDRPASRKDNAGQKKADSLTLVTYKKPPASFDDTLVIVGLVAVFYNPDSLQLGKIKAISKKENYETDVHNCFYLMQNARMVLKQHWPKVNIIETKKNRYLVFIKKDRSQALIDLNSQGDMCGLFLFDGRKEPELADMMNIDTALGFYFGK